MNLELLEEIGLTKSEIKVYLALLELGSSTTGPIVDKSGASSSKIYEILEKLIQKGLASFVITSGTKYFEAADPHRLLDYMKEKEAKLKQQEEDLNKILPELKLKQTMTKHKSETLVFKGMKGAETAFNDILNTLSKGEEMLVIGFSDVQEQFQRFIVKFHKRRAKSGIKARMIFGESLREMVTELQALPGAKVKLHPPQKGNPVGVLIYADKTLFSLSWDNVWIQIKNQRLADAHRERFEDLWNQETNVAKGFDAFTQAWSDLLEEIKPGDNYEVYGAAIGMGKDQKKYADFFKTFHQRRIEKGIHGKILFQQGAEKTINTFGMENLYNKDQEIKMLPYKSNFPIEVFSYGSKTLLLIQKSEPIIITINNKEVAESFKDHFTNLWK